MRNPKVVEFRSLPDNVQDDLTRAEILPIMWPRYRISGYERVFHYRLMTVMRIHLNDLQGPMPCLDTRCSWQHVSTFFGQGAQYSEPGEQLVIAAYECAMEILTDAGSYVTGVDVFNAFQLDLFLFKDMGIGGILAKFIGRIHE